MKTNLLIITLCLLTISTFAQKKEIYVNDDLIKIPKSEFKKIDKSGGFYNLQFELDTLIINVKVQSIEKGKLANVTLDSIRTELSMLSGQTVPNNDLIIINYYHGVDRCNSTGSNSFVREKYKRFLKKLKKFENVSQFFMYKSPKGTLDYGKQLNWIEDKFRSIERLFLPLPYPCGSYVLIDKNGNFYIQKGEYDIEGIISLIKNKKTTFANNI